MNVVELCGITRSAGGLYYACSSLAKALADAGVAVSAWGKMDVHVDADLVLWGDVPLQTYSAYGPLQSSLKLRRMLARHKPDLLHQHGIWTDPQWAALQWQRRTGKPVVVSPHGMLDPWALKNSAWKKKVAGIFFANESLRQASCIHALCRSEAESIRAYGLGNPIAIIPNGVELPELSIPNSNPQAPNRQLLFLGRIHPKKGLKELLEAWRMGQRTWGPDWKLLVAGWDDGGHEQGLRKLAADLGVDGTVGFLGPRFCKEKDALLRSVDAFILPSFSEGLPMSVLEAWAYGLPVVMTRFCNLPEGFEADAAIEVDTDSGSICTGLEKLVAMQEDGRAAMGQRGRHLVERSYGWPRIADSMSQVYKWCIEGGSPPSCVEFHDGNRSA